MPRLGEELGCIDAVGDVGNTPMSIQAVPIRTPVRGAPAVIHVRDGEPPAGEELCPELQPWLRVRGWAFVGFDYERR
ncbi:MAG: hypothetical protein QOD01_2316 [Actinomycetota bacterium]|nr:hypothetical protein [Actinomycetota bacterium]